PPPRPLAPEQRPMSPLAAYRGQTTLSLTRIDALLGLFDAAVERTERALAAAAGGEETEARLWRAKAQLTVLGLWAGGSNGGSEMPANLVRLYQFAANSLSDGNAEQVRGALTVLRTLREGFQGVRPEAVELERAGVIPPLDADHAVHLLG